jgi:ureidoacrylate peracid hydrolase
MATNAQDENLEAARRIAHAPILGSLNEKVRAAHTALIVIDVQNDFCAEGGLVARGGRDVSAAQDMARRLPALIAGARKGSVLVVFVRSFYSTDRNVFLSDVWLEQAARKQGGGYTLTPVCGEGAWDGDYYGDVRPMPDDIVVTKHRYGAFYATDLEMILRSHGIRTIVLTGVSTNVCVETTAREGFVRDFYTVVVGDGTAAYSAEEHETTLKTIDRFFGEITSIAQLQKLWSGANA